MKIEFWQEEEKKHSWRYEEKGDIRVLGKIYVSKTALKEIGNGKYPSKLTITIEEKA